MNENLTTIGSPGYRLLLALWRRDGMPLRVDQLSLDAGVRAAEARELLGTLAAEGLVHATDAGFVLSEPGSELMGNQEDAAYAGLGVFLGMPAKAVASEASETAGRITLAFLDGTLTQIIRLLRRTMPPKGHAEYERQRALCELLDMHLGAGLDAIGRPGEEESDLTDCVQVARAFGLVPPHSGGSA